MNDKVVIGIGVLVIIIAAFFYVPNSSYETHQHIIKVDQKVEQENKYYIIGKDPYVHSSEIKKIEVKPTDYENFVEGKEYFIKYKNSDNKGNILSGYRER